jgi:hypothetical protein
MLARDLATEDPGFVLLTNDEFYLNQHPELKQYTARYESFPPVDVLKQALGQRNPN